MKNENSPIIMGVLAIVVLVMLFNLFGSSGDSDKVRIVEAQEETNQQMIRSAQIGGAVCSLMNNCGK